MEKLLKQYTTFTVGNIGFFECDCMLFGLCNMPAMFQRLMQNCLMELNLTYCLIYLDNIVLFSQTAEEHLHCLSIIFDWFREYNLKLKLSRCDFFRNEITYLAHWVSKDGIHPGNSNKEAIAECTPPWTYMEVHVFLSLVGHYRRFIKGFAWITQPLSKYFAGEEASRKSEVGVTYRRSHEGIQSVEAGMHDSSNFGFCWLHQTILAGDVMCLRRD